MDITGSILNALSEDPVKKTHLSYKANLDFRSLSRYMEMLKNLELIQSCSKEGENSVYFRITQKGKYFLTNYQALVNILKGETVSA
ncbi:MAG: winged helix-turn-helix domain-containing protein [Nitrososphaerales archaeon]